MFWVQVMASLLAGGLMLLIVGTLIDNTVWQTVGLIGFVTGLITLLYSFKEADYRCIGSSYFWSSSASAQSI